MVSRQLKAEPKLPVMKEDIETDKSGENSPYKRTPSLDRLSLLNIVRVSTSKLQENFKDSEHGDPGVISFKKTNSLDKLQQQTLVKVSICEIQEANKNDDGNSRVVTYKKMGSSDKPRCCSSVERCCSSVELRISKLKNTESKNSGEQILYKTPESPVKFLQNSFGPSISEARDIKSNPGTVSDRRLASAVKANSTMHRPRMIMRKRLVRLRRVFATFVLQLCMPSQPPPENKG